MFIGAIGHGMIYIASLSYMNVRVSARHRSFRMALCHVWYLLGYAISSHILFAYAMNNIAELYEQIGYTVLPASGVGLILLMINEVLRSTRFYEYKESLDEHVDGANGNSILLYGRTDTIDLLKTEPPRFDGTELRVTPPKKRSMATFLLIFLKLNGYMIFSAIMSGISIMAVSSEVHYYTYLQWIVSAGAAGGALTCLFISTRKMFILYTGIALAALVAALIVYYDEIDVFRIEIPMYIYYAFMGAIYCVGDISILDTTSIARTEIGLLFGYIIEMLPIAVIQYCIYFAFNSIFYINYAVTFRIHGISIAVASAMLIILVLIVLPNTYQKSLLEIRDELFGIGYLHPHELEQLEAQTVQTTMPQYAYNSRTGTYNYPKTIPTVTLYQSAETRPAPNQYASQRAYDVTAGPSPFAAVGMNNNRYDNDLKMLTPGYIMPRAVIGGAIFSSIAFNM